MLELIDRDKIKTKESYCKIGRQYGRHTDEQIKIYKDRVNFYLDCGLNINNLNHQKQNIFLIYLTRYYNDTSYQIHEMIKFFVEKGVNINCIDFEGKNILHKYLECVNAD